MSNGKKLILWGIYSPRTLRPHWTLHELGLDYDSRPVPPRSEQTQTAEYAKLNPARKVPVLQDGDFTISEGAAISIYLAQRYGNGKLIPPEHTEQRALFYQWCFFSMMELDAHTLYIIRKHIELSQIYGEAPNAVKTAKEGFEKQVRVAAERMSDGRPFVLGEQFTVADILFASCLFGIDMLNYDEKIEISENILEYAARIQEREAYQKANAINYPRMTRS